MKLFIILWICLLSSLKADIKQPSLFKRLADSAEQWFLGPGRLTDFLSLYLRELANGPYHLREFDASSEIDKYTSKIGQLIVQMKSSLHTAVAWTEEEVSKYAWNPNLTMSHLDYIELRKLSPSDERLVTHSSYPFKVMPGRSGVHVPVEVYEGDPQVFHTLQWTNSLDYIFNTTLGLHFIYFASISGIFRVYPAFPWDEVEVDMFDIRQRPWYIQGSEVPRDVLIMLDTTGSMTGQSLRLANVSAQKLISQLDENDYFAVAHFPEADKKEPLAIVTMNVTAPPCFSSFVRATKSNKLRLFRDLSNLTARGYAQFDKAFADALKLFEKLNNSSRSDRTATLCNQVLVMITDNAFEFSDRMEAVLKTKPPHIRVLIYSLGDPISTISEYQKKACQYRGHYKYLPSVGAVSNMMKDYHQHSTRIFSGPNNSPIPPEAIFHGAGDLFQTKEYRGTGLMVSLSIPVYNRTKRSQFIGLMGTDLPIEHMVSELPVHKFGPLGYAFALSPNGYVLFHPALLPQVQNIEDPPKLDWLELEYDVSGQKREIRRRIIDNEKGSEEVIDFIRVMDSVHVHKATRRYFFAGIPNTKFGVAFTIPMGPQYFLASDYEVTYIVERNSRGVFAVNGIPIRHLLENARVFLPSELIAKELTQSWKLRQSSFSELPQRSSEIPITSSVPIVTTTHTSALHNESLTNTTTTTPSSVTGNVTTDLTDWFPFMKLLSRRSVPLLSDPSIPSVNDSIPFNCSAFENGVCVLMAEDSVIQLEELNDTDIVELPAIDNTTTTTSPTVTENIIPTFGFSSTIAPSKSEDLDIVRFLSHIEELDQAFPETISRLLFDLLVAEADMIQYDATTSIKPPVRSRTIFLNSGLGWTTPASAHEEFIHEFTMHPLSPIVQRVFDTDSLTFWISTKPGEPNNWHKNISFIRNMTEMDTGESLFADPLESFTTTSDEINSTVVSSDEHTSEDIGISPPSTSSSSDLEGKSSFSSADAAALPAVTVFKSINLAEGSGFFKAGVIGVTLEPDFLPNEIRKLPECGLNTEKICYLLEDAGYIVAVNDDAMIPVVQRFLGTVDPPLMHALLDNHVYESIKEYNFQGTCTAVEKPEDMGAPGVRLRPNPLTMLGVHTLAFIFYNRFWSLELVNAFPWPFSVLAEFVFHLGTVLADDNNEPYSCIQLIHRYYAPLDTDTVSDLSGVINCSVDCQRSWSIHHIRGTNLRLVIADRRCPTCNTLDEKLPRDPVEDDGPDVCEEAANPRYRRLLDKCPVEYFDNELSTCKSPTQRHLSAQLFIFPFLIYLYLAFL